ncbi:immunoglobulin superfamily member 6 [Oenanthe melanoleuca]|uniref:immunoglobulin superfamily member 6 n=1 Tax=Oenanthe melanoleuca TaxID=2939378 RepID=UPI0024C18D8D|nr:immunoglobulin superfamily member 6 [Oenanthe melanoleuca]
MASFNKLKNVLMLAFDWILYGAGVAEQCRVTVTQPRFQQTDSSMNSVSLPCTFSASGCSSSPQVLWFRYLTNTHQDLCTPACTDNQKYKVQSSANNISLEIKDLTVNDSAVYICGIAFSDSESPLSKQTGDGTVLTVTGPEKQHSNGKLTSMIIVSSLLFLYSSAVLTFFVVYKLKPKLLKKCGKHQTTENCKINSGRKVFQAIAQELQKQRYARHCQQPEELEDDNVYQNR